VSVLVVAQSSSEVPEGLMNNPVYVIFYVYIYLYYCIPDYEISASGPPPP
jgi:hypothetical protein